MREYEDHKDFFIGAIIGIVISGPVIVWLVWYFFK